MSYNIEVRIGSFALVIPAYICVDDHVRSSLSLEFDDNGLGSNIRWVFKHNGCLYDKKVGTGGEVEETSSVVDVLVSGSV